MRATAKRAASQEERSDDHNRGRRTRQDAETDRDKAPRGGGEATLRPAHGASPAPRGHPHKHPTGTHTPPHREGTHTTPQGGRHRDDGNWATARRGGEGGGNRATEPERRGRPRRPTTAAEHTPRRQARGRAKRLCAPRTERARTRERKTNRDSLGAVGAGAGKRFCPQAAPARRAPKRRMNIRLC